MHEPALPLLEFHPVGPERWPDLQALFGEKGACAGCWCMWWRLTRAEFSRQQGEANRQALHEIVLAGRVPGLLAYAGEQPVGWVSVAPRAEFPALDRSPVLARVDDQPVWSIACFFVHRHYRRRGMLVPLIRAALDYARTRGARIVEAYPVDTGGRIPAGSAYTGVVKAFQRAGFVEVARRSARKPIMRYAMG